jgi:hypothetical protein
VVIQRSLQSAVPPKDMYIVSLLAGCGLRITFASRGFRNVVKDNLRLSGELVILQKPRDVIIESVTDLWNRFSTQQISNKR